MFIETSSFAAGEYRWRLRGECWRCVLTRRSGGQGLPAAVTPGPGAALVRTVALFALYSRLGIWKTHRKELYLNYMLRLELWFAKSRSPTVTRPFRAVERTERAWLYGGAAGPVGIHRHRIFLEFICSVYILKYT